MENETVVETPTEEVDTSVDTKAEMSVEQMQSEIDRLKSINLDVIKSRDTAKVKLREYDDLLEQKAKADLIEKDEFKTLYEDLNSKHTNLLNDLKAKEVDMALASALQHAGVTAVPTALKIMDKDNITLNDDGTVVGLQSIVDKLKEDHAILFVSEVSTPSPAIPSEDEVKSVVEIDFSTLDLKNPIDRAKYAEYRKTHGLA